MSKRTYFSLLFLGLLWGVFSSSIIGENPPLLFGWLPLSVVSISLTGVYASVINYLFFKKY